MGFWYHLIGDSATIWCSLRCLKCDKSALLPGHTGKFANPGPKCKQWAAYLIRSGRRARSSRPEDGSRQPEGDILLPLDTMGSLCSKNTTWRDNMPTCQQIYLTCTTILLLIKVYWPHPYQSQLNTLPQVRFWIPVKIPAEYDYIRNAKTTRKWKNQNLTGRDPH